VTGHVLGESLQVKGFLAVYLGIVLAVGGGIVRFISCCKSIDAKSPVFLMDVFHFTWEPE
jgi:uncharacterized membrane protein YeiH